MAIDPLLQVTRLNVLRALWFHVENQFPSGNSTLQITPLTNNKVQTFFVAFEIKVCAYSSNDPLLLQREQITCLIAYRKSKVHPSIFLERRLRMIQLAYTILICLHHCELSIRFCISHTSLIQVLYYRKATNYILCLLQVNLRIKLR